MKRQRAARANRTHAKVNEIGSASNSHHQVGDRNGRQQRGQSQRDESDVHESTGADAKRRRDSRCASLAGAAGSDVKHVGSRREIERQTSREKEKK